MSTTRITTTDASRLYRIPARTIRRWHTEGRLTDPVIERGRHLWDRNEIDQLAHQRNGHRLPRPPQMAHHQQ